MKLAKCANCGSPLVVCKCEHCGAEYGGRGVHASFTQDDVFGTLKVGGVEYDVYLESVTCNRFFCAGQVDVKHRFVLRER